MNPHCSYNLSISFNLHLPRLAGEMLEYFFLLDKIADDLELNEDTSQSYEGDQIDTFIEII